MKFTLVEENNSVAYKTEDLLIDGRSQLDIDFGFVGKPEFEIVPVNTEEWMFIKNDLQYVTKYKTGEIVGWYENELYGSSENILREYIDLEQNEISEHIRSYYAAEGQAAMMSTNDWWKNRSK